MYKRKVAEDLDCGINIAMKVFGAKWKPCILDAIHRGYHRPSEMHRQIAGATARVIDMQLRELELTGIVTKTTSPGFPLHTDYFLTETGKTIIPVIDKIGEWGNKNKHLFKPDRQTEAQLG